MKYNTVFVFILIQYFITFLTCNNNNTEISHFKTVHITDEPVFLNSSKHMLYLQKLQGYEFIKFVNPFFGTDRGGNKFPGCLHPFGMVKVGGDFRHLTNHLKIDSYAGYQRQGYLRQVSMLHVSGTGGSPTYGIIGQLPVIINRDRYNFDENKLNIGLFDIGNGIERAQPDSGHIGYYKISLKNNVDIEFTSGKKTGYLKYTLNQINTNEDFYVLFNLTEHLQSFNRPWWSQQFEFGKLFINDDGKSYEGKVTIKNGWSSTDAYSVYFYGEFNQQFDSFVKFKTKPKTRKFKFGFGSKTNRNLAGMFKFDNQKIMDNPLESKIGISYHSINQAKNNCLDDFNNQWDFDKMVFKNIDVWKEEVFDKVTEVTSCDNTVLDKFYNSLYGSHLMPTEKSGIESPFYNIPLPKFSTGWIDKLNEVEEKRIAQIQNFENQSFKNITSIDYHIFEKEENQNNTNRNTNLIKNEWLKKSRKNKIQIVGQEPICEDFEMPSLNTPYYDDWFTIWDTYRTLHPLLFIIQPEKSKDMINSLSLIAEYEIFPPDGRSASRSGRTQGGSNSDILISEAISKKIVYDKFEKCRLYKASWRNANIIPPYINDISASDATNKFGRGALQDWIELGFVSTDFTRSLTRTVEYSNNDFSVALTANDVGENDVVVQEYLRRSRNWANLWNPDLSLEHYNYSGFLNPKMGTNTRGIYRNNPLAKRNANLNQFISNYNPADCGGCYWGDHSYEGTSIEYMFSINHDIPHLISLIGEEKFEERLDDLYNLHCSPIKAIESGLKFKFKSLSGRNCGFADVANEPSFGAGYLYSYINMQDKTAATIDFLTTVEFQTGSKAIPGNSDSGAMESWLWFGLIGIYPVPGTDLYLIGTPQLSHLKINDKLEIEVKNLNCSQDNGKRQNIYIKSVTLNGENLQRSWLKHDELFENKIENEPNHLIFEMTLEPLGWDKEYKTPPSYDKILYKNY